MTQEKGPRESIQSRNIHQLPNFLFGFPRRVHTTEQKGTWFPLHAMEGDSTRLTENTVVFHSEVVKGSLSGKGRKTIIFKQSKLVWVPICLVPLVALVVPLLFIFPTLTCEQWLLKAIIKFVTQQLNTVKLMDLRSQYENLRPILCKADELRWFRDLSTGRVGNV